MLAVIFGLFGLIVGSFLNVVILRKGADSIQGRSGCMSCGHQLAWYDLVPVVSWMMLRGTCRYCGSRISFQYPLVEVTTALLFAGIGGALFPIGILYRIVFCVIVALLVIITVYDIHHTIIPDAWVYLFDILAFVTMPFLYASMTPITLSVWPLFAAGLFSAAPFAFLWLVSGGKWMGLGDAKLALGIGWLLGPWAGVVSVMFSFVLGTCIMVPLLLLGRFTHSTSFPLARLGLTMKSEVPFGPFLVASCLLFWFAELYGVDLIGFYLTLWT